MHWRICVAHEELQAALGVAFSPAKVEQLIIREGIAKGVRANLCAIDGIVLLFAIIVDVQLPIISFQCAFNGVHTHLREDALLNECRILRPANVHRHVAFGVQGNQDGDLAGDRGAG